VAAAARLSAAQRRESRATLLSDQLLLEPAVAKAKAALADARHALGAAQRAAAPSSFAPAASNLLAGPTYDSGWVFPVGGGPGVVTASHTHHDYPAVDIAAPAGSPLAPAGGLVPGLRRHRLHLAGRGGHRHPDARPRHGRGAGPGARRRPRLHGRPADPGRALQPGLISAEKKVMRRLMFSAAVFVALAMTAISFAAGRQLAVTPTSASQLPSTPLTLVVPDLRREAFVFAKGQLQDAGFAWKVVGGAPGYPANVVVSQSPAPG